MYVCSSSNPHMLAHVFVLVRMHEMCLHNPCIKAGQHCATITLCITLYKPQENQAAWKVLVDPAATELAAHNTNYFHQQIVN